MLRRVPSRVPSRVPAIPPECYEDGILPVVNLFHAPSKAKTHREDDQSHEAEHAPDHDCAYGGSSQVLRRARVQKCRVRSHVAQGLSSELEAFLIVIYGEINACVWGGGRKPISITLPHGFHRARRRRRRDSVLFGGWWGTQSGSYLIRRLYPTPLLAKAPAHDRC